MRSALTVALLIAFCGTAAAQRHAGHPAGRVAEELPRPSIGLPLPSIGLPLPPIGLPLPPIGLSPLPSPTTAHRFERPGSPGRSGHRNNGAFLYVPAYGWPFPYLSETYLPSSPVPSLPTPPAPYAPAVGHLRLDLPAILDPQIYVDGYYVGLMSDSNGELTLDAGPHAIELREEGYQDVHVDVQITADAVTTYRGTLKPILPPRGVAAQPPSALPSAPPAPAPTTIYMIPGCYVGNVAPKNATLPPGCDESGAIVFPSRQ